MLTTDDILSNIIDEINSEHLDKVANEVFLTSTDKIKQQINSELNSYSLNEKISKYDFNFQIHNLEDLMLFFIQANNIDYMDLLHSISKTNNNEDINNSIKTQFSQHLMKLAYRTIIFDLNRHRINKTFKTDTETSQFNEYILMLNDKKYRKNFIKRYKNLVKLIELNIKQVNNYIIRFLECLIVDLPDLKQLIKHSSTLVSIQLSLGDTHNNGEFVVKCNFEDSSIYYKPRNGNIDKLYSVIIKHINKSMDKKLKYPKNLMKNNYFWSSEVTNEECERISDVHNFYRELGVHLCLLYILGATDFHSDNLIASQSHPVLVDLESVLGNKLTNKMFEDATAFNRYKLSSSVKSTGILPFVFGSLEGSDFSGVGGKERTSSFKVPAIKNGATSHMKVQSEHITLPEAKNHPKYEGEFIDEKKYKNDLILGFRETYDFILKNKEKFINFLNTHMKNINVRYINNATMHYGRILNLSYHPMILQSLTLRKLFISYYLYNDYDKLSLNEIDDVINMNIPYFYFNLDTKHLYHLNECHKNYFDYKLKDSILFKLNSLSAEDKLWQTELVLDSLKEDDMEFVPHMSQHSIKDYRFPLERDKSDKSIKFDTLIKDIEDIVESEQIDLNNSYSWMTKELYGKKGSRRVEREVMDVNLYRGLSGMALYYLSLYIYTNNNLFLIKSQKIITQIKTEIEQHDDFPLGAFDGIYSYVYVCAIMYKNTKDVYYIEESIKYINKSKHRLKIDRYNDFISGNAGALTILINIYNLLEKPIHKKDVLDAIEISVNRLIMNSTKNDNGLITWKTGESDVDLGFAHGNSGIAYALHLYTEKINRDYNIKQTVLLANRFEDMHRVKNYWPHPYSKESKPPFAWCHGSPGIMLNRENSKYFTKNKSDIINHIFYKGFSRTHCLCHGDLGNAMILKDILKDDKRISNVIFDILKDFKGDDLKCGVGNNIHTVDLLTGITGISYGLIYIMNYNIPNILKLEI
ncbi:type 2 lanthipeptide synthetase LanM (plasmid) [Staphylococcus aureus]|uniref:type 2 lanthipeptide synthetase LanM n=1 Tax=Staphylococcus aureus TaxID=1280 RepID=UPI0021D1ABBD|nr:type 2 lanthipeptide synthetase LanM [Staphylococcus aureus]UXT64002.1 type 2 lanthipeptide synthetase LanM [Staphylococcus aureus]